MRFEYKNHENRITCSSGLTTICFIGKSSSTFYAVNWEDHPLMLAIESIDELEAEFESSMLRIITSLVLI